MDIVQKPTRYAHSRGHTDVCYSQDGLKLVTCGNDGDIRIWGGFDDSDPAQTCVGEWSLCARQHENYLYIATDDNDVQVVKFPTGERHRILTKFTAHVNHIAISQEIIAIAAEDMEIKLMDLSESKDDITFSGLSAPPLSIALCPSAKLLAVSSGDGQLRIWDVETRALLKEFSCVPKVNSFMNAKLLCRIDFDPSGTMLAYPDKNSIIILNTSDWSSKPFTWQKINSNYSIVQYSPCGKLLAATTEKGDLVIWQVSTEAVVSVTEHPRSVSLCSLMWNPAGNGEIAFCDVQGQLGVLRNCNSLVNATVLDAETENLTNDTDFTDFKFNVDDDEDDENVVSIEKLKREVMGSKSDFDKDSVRSLTPRPRTPEVSLQKPFMPSSTPEHLSRRYLCWNEVGIVRGYSEDIDKDEQKSIEVEFHDSSFHNSMMLQNYQVYTMASLSTKTLVIANSSQINIIPLFGAREWNLTTADDEEIVLIANSDQLICFATSKYIVHICTVFGTQKGVLAVPGPLVSMSAQRSFLLIAYHHAPPRRNDQCISLILVKAEGVSIKSKEIHCALRPESSLLWLGFTDVGSPSIQDSTGVVSLYPLKSKTWFPFCETTKDRVADGFFVTAIFESYQTIRGIRCRGSVYPTFIPRPTLIELPLMPLFAELTTEKSQMEANLFTWSSLQVDNVEKKYKETALKTFALACKNKLDQRALELIEMIGNPQLVNLALKYASKLDKQRLAEKLAEITSKFQDNEPECEINTDASISTPQSALKPINRKLILNSGLKRSLKKNERSKSLASPMSPTIEHLPSTSAEQSQNSEATDDTISNTQESLFADEIPQETARNPFLKSLKKKNEATYNPLSLTDKFAGYEVEVSKKDKTASNKSSEKRKQPESETEKQKEKQRKLDKFMFSKRS